MAKYKLILPDPVRPGTADIPRRLAGMGASLMNDQKTIVVKPGDKAPTEAYLNEVLADYGGSVELMSDDSAEDSADSGEANPTDKS